MTKRPKPVFERVSADVNGTSVTLAKVELSSATTPPPSSTRLGYRPSARQMEVTNG